jgi:hypothetical protein
MLTSCFMKSRQFQWTTKSKAITFTLRRGLYSYLVVQVVENLIRQIFKSFVRAFFLRPRSLYIKPSLNNPKRDLHINKE